MGEIREALEMAPMQTSKGRKMKKPRPIKVPAREVSPEVVAEIEGEDGAAEDLGVIELGLERSLEEKDAVKDPAPEQSNDPETEIMKKEEDEKYQLPGTDDEKEADEENDYQLPQESDNEEKPASGEQKAIQEEPTQVQDA